MIKDLIDTAASGCMIVLLLSILLSLVRLLRGPNDADRVIAVDVIALLTSGLLGVLAIRYDDSHYLSVALVIALVSFLSTVAWSFFIRHRAREERNTDGP